jgi:hypothetical protein
MEVAPTHTVPATPARSSNLRRTLTILGAVFVFVFAFWRFSDALRASTFHPDESRWINRGIYLQELSHPLGSFWSDSYLIRGQPPMGSYITGFGLWVQGQSLHQNGPWNFVFGNDGDVNWNVTNGNVPAVDVLLDARKTSIALGLILVLTTYAIVTLLSNWVGGVVAGVFLAAHPLTIYLATLAVSDMAFTTIIALSGFCALMLSRRPSWWWAIALGILMGMGASLKLSPIFLAIAVAGVGVLILLEPVARKFPGIRLLYRHLGVGLPDVHRVGIMLLSLPIIAGAFFLASYPYLWPDPVGRTEALFEFRRNEMENQSRIWGDQAITTRQEALERTWNMLEFRYSTSGRLLAWLGIEPGNPDHKEGFDLPFALAGLLIFIALALWRGFRTPHLLTLIVLSGQVAIILVGININFNRYYLPIVLYLAIGLGIGTGTALDWLRAQWSRFRRGRSAAHVPAQNPGSPIPS